MSNAIVPLNPAQLPAAAAKRLAEGRGIAKNLSEGTGAPIDVLSIRGKNFHERINGEELQTPRPMYEYDVVILDGTPGLGKTYYINPYQDGSMAPPDCWSLNGIKPDPQSPAIQSPTCRGCRWNVFGSKIMQDRPGVQSKAKACADSRRLAVLPAYKLAPTDGSDPNPMLLRIPATSLVALKNYSSELERMGIPANAVVTRLGFDHTVTHPQITFIVAGMLNDTQYSHIDYLLRVDAKDPLGRYEDERVRRILEAPPPGEDIDPSETQGIQITNRNQAPVQPPAVEAVVPNQGVWTPGQQKEEPKVVQQQPTEPPAPPAGIIKLPDGKFFNPATGQYVGDPNASLPPEGSIKLPDGKWFVPSTGQYWEPAQEAKEEAQPEVAPKATEAPKPISERAKAEPAPSAAPGPQAGWKPGPAAGVGAAPGPGWRPPQGSPEVKDEEVPDFIKKGNGPVIEGTATEVKDEEPPAQPTAAKRRKPAPPTVEAASGATAAPASLDALLSEIDLGQN